MKFFAFLSFCAAAASLVYFFGALKEDNSTDIIPMKHNITDRELVITSNRRSVLIIRAYATSSNGPSATISDLQKYIFTDSNSLKQQMYRCSGGVIDIYQSSYGIIDVNLNDQSTSRMTVDNFVLAIMRKALNHVSSSYRDIRQAADHVFIMLPKSFTGFVASAEVVSTKRSFGALSWYQDNYALSLTSLQHEFAHNLGLNHASWKGDEYGDYTGNMGRSLKTKQGPLMCYNAANHWQLNWFQGRRLDLGTYGPSTQRSITVSAFVDYVGSSTGQYVLVRVGELYMQYNRAKKHNEGTRGMSDKLVIIRENGQSTTLLSGLDLKNPLYKEGNLEIRVCSVKTVGNVDTMEIVVRNGPTSCSSNKAKSSDGSTTWSQTPNQSWKSKPNSGGNTWFQAPNQSWKSKPKGGGTTWSQTPTWNSKPKTGTNSNFSWKPVVDFPKVSDKPKNNVNNKSSWSLRGTGFRCVKGC